MIKLYKADTEGKLRYAEAWTVESAKSIILHTGSVGRDGKKQSFSWDATTEDEQTALERVLASARKDGYAEIPLDEHLWAVIQFRMKSAMGTKRELQKRHRIEKNLDTVLGWKGVGHVDGGDTGEFKMNIFTLVVNEEQGVPAIKGYLRKYHEDLHNATIAVRAYAGDGYRVVHPADYEGAFEV
ncbi:MAG: hypothetical protein O3A00_13100 [Planctomycetota bacterium]|nr:hypothetical protein [Planctomycetota bacterium]